MAQKTLYVLYNADASVLGKLKYGYRKIVHAQASEPACAACDITHGGLSLSESPAWLEAKEEIERGALKVVQWHRDELPPKLKEYIVEHGIRYPVAVLDQGGDDFTVAMDSSELAACNGDAQEFVRKLKNRGLIQNLSNL